MSAQSTAVAARHARAELADREFRGPVPWSVQDLTRLAGGYAFAFVVIGIAWFGASDQVAWNDAQVLWVNVGGAGLILAALSSAIWILYGRRMVGRKRLLLLALLEERQQLVASTRRKPAPAFSADEPLAGVALVTGNGMSKYHRASCPLVAGKAIREASANSVNADGLVPCGVCEPG